MAIPELALQIDLFTGEMVDTRTSYQKKKDKERTAPQQIQMFSTPDIVQFGFNPKSAYSDWLQQAEIPALELSLEDLRTPEEVESDLMREAEKHMLSLFSTTLFCQDVAEATNNPEQTPIILFSADKYAKKHGLRAHLRKQAIQARSRL